MCLRSLAVLLLLGLTGCASGPSPLALALRDRAVFDLRCHSLAWTRLDDRTFGVRGCRQRAVYQTSCLVGRWGPTACSWVRDGEIARDVSAPRS